MSPNACARLREVAPELALGVLDGAERAEAVSHLASCTRCQNHVADLTEVADVLPAAVAEREPPAGFAVRTLGSMRVERPRSHRRWVATTAVAVAAAAIVSIAAVRVIDARSETGAPVEAVSASTPMARAQMLSDSDGGPAGWVYVADGHTVAVAVAYGVASGRYDIEVRTDHQRPVVIGGVDVDQYRGTWMGHSKVAITPGDTVALVAADGTSVCHGMVEAAS